MKSIDQTLLHLFVVNFIGWEMYSVILFLSELQNTYYIVITYPVSIGENNETFNGVFQLPNIPWPFEVLEMIHSLAFNLFFQTSSLLKQNEKMINERSYILLSIS